MPEQIAFLEEWGTYGLEFLKKENNGEATSTHFIVTALLLSKNNVEEAERVLSAVGKKYFEDGIIDSLAVDSDH
ncbi:MAG TPA: hypothetical protein VGN64_00040, partial [Dyadobacter sp.]|nr:hypothetical protein [Dyadobacter sp.]